MSEAPDIPDEVLADAPLPNDADDAPEISTEDRALSMGWTPKEQFKGDPERWVDAEAFVKRGDEFLPFLKANNKALERAVQKANAKAEKLEKTLERFAQHHSKTEQRAYAKAKSDLEAELEQYAAAGNAKAVKEVADDLIALEREATGPKAGEATAQDEPPEWFATWKSDNVWFGKDKALTAAAVAIANEAENDGYSEKALAKEVDRRLREEFPNKFAKAENPNRRGPAAVEGSANAARQRGKSYADLPADARQACDEFVKKGLLTREAYCKDFFS